MQRILSLLLSLCLLLPLSRPFAFSEKRRVSVLAVGDNIVHGAVYADAGRSAASRASTDGESEAYSFDSMYENVAAIVAAADLAIINQEGPVTSRAPSGYPLFNAPSELAKALARTGFDVVNLANNHALDMDTGKHSGGLRDTLALFRERGVTPIGTYANAEERDAITVINKNGLRVALLSYTFFTNGLTEPSEADWGVHRWEESAVRRDMSRAKDLADFVLVSVHWGEEGTSTPNETQRNAAALLASLGADVILGHHSHTLQPIEWIEREGGGRTLVAYSLGNFLSAMLYPQYMVGGMLTFTLVANEKGHTVEEVRFTPTVCHYERAVSSATDGRTLKTRWGLSVYPMSAYTEELANRHGATLYANFSFDTLRGFVRDTIPAEFLSESDALGAHLVE